MFAIYKKQLAVNKSQYRSQPLRMGGGSEASDDIHSRNSDESDIEYEAENEENEIDRSQLNLEILEDLDKFMKLTRLDAQNHYDTLIQSKKDSSSRDITDSKLNLENINKNIVLLEEYCSIDTRLQQFPLEQRASWGFYIAQTKNESRLKDFPLTH